MPTAKKTCGATPSVEVEVEVEASTTKTSGICSWASKMVPVSCQGIMPDYQNSSPLSQNLQVTVVIFPLMINQNIALSLLAIGHSYSASFVLTGWVVFVKVIIVLIYSCDNCFELRYGYVWQQDLFVRCNSFLIPRTNCPFLFCKSGIRPELNSVRSLLIVVGTSTMQLSVSQKAKSPHRTSTECLPSPKRLITVLIWLANTSSIWFKTHIVFINLFLIFQR